MGDLEDQFDSENPLEASFSKIVYDIDDDDIIRHNLKSLTADVLSERIIGAESMIREDNFILIQVNYFKDVYYVSAQQYVILARKRLEKMSRGDFSQDSSV